MGGRIMLGAAALIVAAYVMGRREGALREALARLPGDGVHPDLLRAHAETAGTLAPDASAARRGRAVTWLAQEGSAPAAPAAAPASADDDGDEWTTLLEILAAPVEGADGTAEPAGPPVEEIAPGWAAAVPGFSHAPAATAAPRAAAPPAEVASGTFAVSGFAVAAGDLAFGRVTFPRRLSHVPAPGAVTLRVEGAENVPESGVAVMSDGSFAPCREGMTLVAAAHAAGRFTVRGTYAVAAPAPLQ